MWWWEVIPRIYNATNRIQIDTQNLLRQGMTMHEELQALRDRAAAIDSKGDAILALLADVKAKLAAIVDNAADLEAAKAAITEVTGVLDSQLQQFEAALPPEPPVDPS